MIFIRPACDKSIIKVRKVQLRKHLIFLPSRCSFAPLCANTRRTTIHSKHLIDNHETYHKMTVILLFCKNYKVKKSKSFFCIAPKLSLQKVPPYLETPFPFNNIPIFYKKRKLLTTYLLVLESLS